MYSSVLSLATAQYDAYKPVISINVHHTPRMKEPIKISHIVIFTPLLEERAPEAELGFQLYQTVFLYFAR